MSGEVTHPVEKQQEDGLLCALVIVLKSWLDLVVPSETHKEMREEVR